METRKSTLKSTAPSNPGSECSEGSSGLLPGEAERAESEARGASAGEGPDPCHGAEPFSGGRVLSDPVWFLPLPKTSLWFFLLTNVN